mgnify:CR=1 FL=1
MFKSDRLVHCSPGKVGECLQRLGDQSQVPVCLLPWELLREAEEVGAQDGRAQVAQEQAARDQLGGHLASVHLNMTLDSVYSVS